MPCGIKSAISQTKTTTSSKASRAPKPNMHRSGLTAQPTPTRRNGCAPRESEATFSNSHTGARCGPPPSPAHSGSEVNSHGSPSAQTVLRSPLLQSVPTAVGQSETCPLASQRGNATNARPHHFGAADAQAVLAKRGGSVSCGRPFFLVLLSHRSAQKRNRERLLFTGSFQSPSPSKHPF